MGRSPDGYQRFERAAELPMLVLSLAFLPILVVPQVAALSESADAGFTAAAWLIWAAFVVEYVVLLYLAPDRWRMVRTHLFDLAIIVLPFLRPLRAARALRAVAGLGRAVSGFQAVTSRKGFRGFIVLVLALIASGGVLTYAFERSNEASTFHNMGDALWWAVVTSTTVGYGDHFPITAEGRAVAVVLMIVGVGLLSVVTANVAAYLVDSGEGSADGGISEVNERLARIEATLAELRQVQRPLSSEEGPT